MLYLSPQTPDVGKKWLKRAASVKNEESSSDQNQDNGEVRFFS